MKQASLVALSALVGAAALGCGTVSTRRPAAHSPAPAEAWALLRETSDPYLLNGVRVEPGQFSPEALQRLSNSRDALVRKAAETARQLRFLSDPRPGAGSPQAVDAAVARYPQLIGDRVVAALSTPNGEEDIRAAAGALETFAGPEAQQALNRGRALALLHHGMSLALQEDIRQWEVASRSGRPEPGAAIRVLMDTQRRGLVMIKNMGSAPLHNCVIFTRLRPDVQRVREAAAREDTVGRGLTLMGFSPEFAEQSRLAARLRYLLDEQDKGQMSYVPVLHPGDNVSAWFAGVVSFRMSTDAEISFWSDEFAVEHRRPANWPKFKAEVEARRHTPSPTPSEYPFGSSAPRRNPPIPGASSQRRYLGPGESRFAPGRDLPPPPSRAGVRDGFTRFGPGGRSPGRQGGDEPRPPSIPRRSRVSDPAVWSARPRRAPRSEVRGADLPGAGDTGRTGKPPAP